MFPEIAMGSWKRQRDKRCLSSQRWLLKKVGSKAWTGARPVGVEMVNSGDGYSAVVSQEQREFVGLGLELAFPFADSDWRGAKGSGVLGFPLRE